MTYRRRGIAFLNTMVATFPFILAITATGYQISKQTMRLQAATNQETSAEAIVRNLIRRIQNDAGRAKRAKVTATDNGYLLELNLAEGVVTYLAATSGVTRVEKHDDGAEIAYSWSLAEKLIGFHIELVGASRQVVWITVTRPVAAERGPLVARQLAAAAAVGRGGKS